MRISDWSSDVCSSDLLAWWLARMPRHDWRQALPYALVIGGAIGNLIDRLMHGYVIDFIDAFWGEYHWPAFNLADSAIVAGAIGLALFRFVPRRAAPARRCSQPAHRVCHTETGMSSVRERGVRSV